MHPKPENRIQKPVLEFAKTVSEKMAGFAIPTQIMSLSLTRSHNMITVTTK